MNAPEISQWQFCAASLMFESSSAFPTACSAVNGGATAISTRSRTIDTAPRSSRTSASASPTVLFIFQLPATIIRRFGLPIESPLSFDGTEAVRARDPL